jgi:Rgg/GadR/MutR family transcriptional activator
MLETQDLGKFFKSMRKKRGYTLKELETPCLDSSQLSRFENSKIDLSGKRLLMAISAIKMTPAEFFSAYDACYKNELVSFKKDLSDYVAMGDLEALRKFLILNPKNKLKKLFNIVVKCGILEVSGENLVTRSEYQLIEEYLMMIDEWTLFEISLLDACFKILDIEEMYWIGLDMLENDTFHQNLSQYLVMIRQILMKLHVRLILHGKYRYAERFEQALDKLISSNDVMEKMTFHIYKKLRCYKQFKESRFLVEIKRYIQVLKEFGVSDLAVDFEKLLD